MVVNRECLEGHVNINLIRPGVIVDKIEIERWCVVKQYANVRLTR